MAKDLNKVMIIGRLGKDPEMRHTPGGSPVTTFSVATGRQWKDGSGELHEETEWFNVVTWNKLAEICYEHLRKSSRVYIEGRLQTRHWEDQNGVMHYRTEVVASDMIMLDSRVSREQSHYGDEPPYHHPDHRSPARGQQAKDDFAIGDEDIPF